MGSHWVIEVPDLNNPGQVMWQHVPLNFKELKQLKEAVCSYGPLAPFTIAMMETFSAFNLTPSDWQQLGRATLNGGDYCCIKGNFRRHVSPQPK